VIVRWGLAELPHTLREVGIERPFLIAAERWQSLDLPREFRWSEVPSAEVVVPDAAAAVVIAVTAVATGAPRAMAAGVCAK